jgi:hypothetical protein
LNSLPDKGKKLITQISDLEQAMSSLELDIKRMGPSSSETPGNVTLPSSSTHQTDHYRPNHEKHAYERPKYNQPFNPPQQVNQLRYPASTMSSNPQKTLKQSVLAPAQFRGQPNIKIMTVDKDGNRQTKMLDHTVPLPSHVLQQMYAANPQAMTLYGGKMNAARLKQVGSITEEAIIRLHK